MKTERRHELATNVLADWLGEKIETLKPYSAAVSVTALLVVVIIVATVLWFQNRDTNAAKAWESYFAALENQSPDNAQDKLEEVAESYPRSPAGMWSRLSLADTQLANGVEDLFKDRPAGKKSLERAIADYRVVLEQAPRDSLLAERASFGLAEAYESKDELDQAREQYRAVIDRWPNGAFSSAAKDRLADLDRKSTKDFYDWFAKQSPQPKASKGLGALGEKPDFDFNKLSDEPFESSLNVGGKKVGGNIKDNPEAADAGQREKQSNEQGSKEDEKD